MGKLISKILAFVTSFTTRIGLGQFVKQYTPLAVQIVEGLRKVRTNEDFLLWKAEAFALLKEATGEVKDTWIAILVAAAEHLTGPGTKSGNWFTKAFGTVWRFITGYTPELATLLRKYGPAAQQIVLDALAAQNNAQFKDIELKAIAQLRAVYTDISSSLAGLIINAVFENLKASRRV